MTDNEKKVIAEAEKAIELAAEAFKDLNAAKEKMKQAEAALSVSALKMELVSNGGGESSGVFKKLTDSMDFYRSLATSTLDAIAAAGKAIGEG